VDEVYTRGVQFLINTQTQDGCWVDPNGHGKDPGAVGLCMLAIMAQGSDPMSGPHAAPIHQSIRYILAHQDEKSGMIGDTMYSHGFATLALAEAYGMVTDIQMGDPLKRAINLILSAQQQNPKKAWRYRPDAIDADSTVTGCQLMALFAARNAGIEIPEQAITSGLNYFSDTTNDRGIVGYEEKSSREEATDMTMTSIALLCHQLSKIKSSSNDLMLDYLKSHEGYNNKNHYFYHKYYYSQALFHADPDFWIKWNASHLQGMRQMQQADGCFDSNVKSPIDTALGLLSLALNYRFLPIYER
jgi:hypothetical protein